MKLRVSISLISLLFLIAPSMSFAQYDPNLFFRETLDSNRAKSQKGIIDNVIRGVLSQPLTDENEDEWEDAFSSMEVLGYRDHLTDSAVKFALENLWNRPLSFQRTVLETVHAVYNGKFDRQLIHIIQNTDDPAVFTAASVDLMGADPQKGGEILGQLNETFGDGIDSLPQLKRLKFWIENYTDRKIDRNEMSKILKAILNKDFLKGNTVLFSFQRSNRLYPGLAIVRGKDGKFVSFDDSLFYVPQLARATSNFPYFIRMGNTPQGIFSMYGFGVSRSSSIGPTANIQMGMPVELSIGKFYHNAAVGDTEWTKEKYSRLLPKSIRDYAPLYQTYWAGEMGRNEIISHGTTVNPEYYKGKPYYPFTPTDGCLSTKENWNGKLIESDQIKLVNAILKAGGADGFVVVIDIDNQTEPVTIEEISKFISYNDQF